MMFSSTLFDYKKSVLILTSISFFFFFIHKIFTFMIIEVYDFLRANNLKS